MSGIWRAIRSALTRSRPPQSQGRSISDLRPFEAGDRVILRPIRDRNAASFFSPVLTPEGRIATHKGSIAHADIIGRRVRDVVRSTYSKAEKSGSEFRLHQVRLDDYIRFTKRLVTPLYPQDTQLIVAQLDLHPDVFDLEDSPEPDAPKLEILEAGTGHGSLTLYLSRAIHAANPPVPRSLRAGHDNTVSEDDDSTDPLLEWRTQRRAVVHSIEVSGKHSAHAQRIVKGFRHGLYANNIDFHIADVSEWVTERLEAKDSSPFLSAAFLDLPKSEDHLSAVASALRVDSPLIVFNPSLTQIMECMKKVKEDGLPLDLDRVLELGVNGGSGGREWDVRAVRPRAGQKQTTDSSPVSSEEEKEVSTIEDGPILEDALDATESTPSQSQEWKMVCRPKVGEMVVGGGFLGIFRKTRDKQSSL